MASATAIDENHKAEAATEVVGDAIQRLYRYSTWVHVGPGAGECEAVDELAGTNDCSNPLHFHAWCRLPNKVQHRAIREKALAARARKTRLMRDEESDAWAVLEEEIDGVRFAGEVGREALIEDLMAKHHWRDYLEAVRDLAETEDPDDPDGGKLWGHIGDDQRRYEVLADMPEDDRPADEHQSLLRHLDAYNDALNKRYEEIAAPRREALKQREFEDLLTEMRADQIKQIGDDEFMHVYSLGSWLVGVRRSKNGPAWFGDEAAIEEAAPEVIDALKETYDDLEQTKVREDAEGNP